MSLMSFSTHWGLGDHPPMFTFACDTSTFLSDLFHVHSAAAIRPPNMKQHLRRQALSTLSLHLPCLIAPQIVYMMGSAATGKLTTLQHDPFSVSGQKWSYCAELDYIEDVGYGCQYIHCLVCLAVGGDALVESNNVDGKAFVDPRNLNGSLEAARQNFL